MGYFSELDLSIRHPSRVAGPKPRGYRKVTRRQHQRKMAIYRRREKKRENEAAGRDYVAQPQNVAENVARWAAVQPQFIWTPQGLIPVPQGNRHETNQTLAPQKILHPLPVG